MTALFIILPAVLLAVGLGVLVYITSKSNKTKPAYTYAQGTIIELQTTNEPYVVIKYEVKGQIYQLKEKLNMKEEPIKVGQVTVGVKSVPAVPAEVGRSVIIQHDIKDPTRAFWVANAQSKQ